MQRGDRATGRHTAPPVGFSRSLTSLVGRTTDIASIKELLRRSDVPIITLHGIGGVGKTRLAARLAADLVGDFSEGVYFVPLAGLQDPQLVPATIASVLDLRYNSEPAHEAIRRWCRSRNALLVLDNFEHLLPAAGLVHDVVGESSHLKVLVTSRTPLRVSGEQEFHVAPLGVPPFDLDDPQTIASYESVELFVRRVQAQDPNRRISEDDMRCIARICARLDGIPLALELAASRMRLFPPPVLLARLDARFDLLSGGQRDLPDRQRTLRASLDWSFGLLTSAEQRLLSRMSIFDGATIEAIEQVCYEKDISKSLVDDLTGLIEHDLVQRSPEDPVRLRLLETVREYAAHELESSGEADAVADLYMSYYTNLAERLAQAVDGPEQAKVLAQWDLERNNFRNAGRMAIDRGEMESALRLAAAQGRFWDIRFAYDEGRRYLADALRLAVDETALAPQFSKACSWGAVLALRQGDWSDGEGLALRSLAFCRSRSDTYGVAFSLHILGIIASEVSRYQDAKQYFGEALALRQEIGDVAGRAKTLHNLAAVNLYQDDYEGTLELCSQSLALFRELGSQQGVAWSLDLQGWAYVYLGQPVDARRFFEESVALSLELDDRFILFDALQGLADTLRLQGHASLSAQYLSASDTMRSEIGAQRSLHCQRAFERSRTALQGELPASAFVAAWEAGAARSLGSLIAELASAVRRPRSTRVAEEGPRFTRRELEVLELVAEGLSDRKIGRRLGISTTTASKHVANMLGKSGLANRVQLARLAPGTDRDAPSATDSGESTSTT